MKQVSNLLDKERALISRLASVTIIVILSGFITYFYQSHSVWQQLTYILHTIIGIALSILLVQYVVTHFKRTLGVRRPLVLISGILAITLFGLLVATGLHITFAGQHESLRWVNEYHIISAYFAVLFILIHLIVHLYIETSQRKKAKSNKFPSLTKSTLKIALISSAASLLIVAISSFIYGTLETEYFDEAKIQPYQLPFGNHPFRPSQTETITGGFMDVRRVGGSDRCGDCHNSITDEWRSSIHAQAASDISYQTNINLLAKTKGIAATRYCEGCHAPVALLSGELTEGGKLDTHGHMHEGVSCMGCHGIDKVVHLNGVASYRFVPASNYLFSDKQTWLARKIHNFIIQIQPRQHRRDMARPVSSDSTLCATCHTAFIDKDLNNWGWIKLQDEYGAWLKSPYSGQTQQSFSQSSIVRCHDCHMPLVKSKDPSRDKNGLVRSHRTLGANTVIPWLNNDYEQLSKTIEFLQSDKVRINIEEPNRTQAIRSKKFIDPSISTDKNAPAYFYLGEEVNIKVVVTNSQVGHNFPGGTIDINEVWINFKAVDAQNNVIYESGEINSGNDVDPNAYFYRSLPIDRNGKHIWRHDLFNMTGNSYKNIIPSGKSDVVDYKFIIPSWAKSPLSVSAVLRYRKFNNKYAKWALQDDRINPPIVDMARHAITLPVRIKKEIE